MIGKIHSIETFGAVDGPGIRTVFFMQGCPARCLYCHNPDSWPADKGEKIEVEEVVHWALRGQPYYGSKGGVTFSGGEPLLQGKFLTEAIHALHKVDIQSAIDTSGTYLDDYSDEAIRQCDLVLLDVKHPDPERFEIIAGQPQDTLLALIDIINALDCSADELLCIEIKKAKPVFDSWMSEQLADCSADEAKIIKETVVSLKKSLRKVYGKSSKYRYD